MYTVLGGYLIAVIGIGFIVLGVYAGSVAMKHKLNKQEKSE